MRPGAAAFAAAYGAFFAAGGVFLPFWPAHLAALGLGPATIGALLALVHGLRLVAPLGAAALADRHGHRRGILRALGVLGALAGLVLGMARSPAALVAGLVLYGIAVHGVLPLLDAQALAWLGADGHRYGRLRLWGSVGFLAAALAVGALAERAGDDAIPAALALALAASALSLWTVPAATPGERGEQLSARAFVRALGGPPLRRFLAIVFLHQAGFGGYYAFYTLYLAAHGYASTTVGAFWAFAVLAEIALFAIGPRLLRRRSLEPWLRVALAATVVRWLVVAALPGSPALMLAAQALHFAGFGLFHSVGVLLAPRLVPPGGATRALALVSAVGWGAGGILGSLLAGTLWSALGPPAVFYAAALASLGALWLAWRPLQGGGGAADDSSQAPDEASRQAVCQ
ncbi:MAG: MFS transporter [Proteobacteria bacterium]|nr:MFS transporter [Pseudomonadota bacterium]